MDNEPVDQVEDSQPIQSEAPDTQPSGAESAPPLGGGAYQQQAAPNQSQSPWDAFKRLPEFQGADDRAIAARLYNAMEREKAASHALAQYQQVLPYAQEWLSNRREIEEYRQWKSQQQQAAQPAMPQAKQPEAEKWWNPPKVRDAYKRYLTKDEEGRDVISPDAPLDAKHELMEYMQYRADFARNFLDDPQKALGPMISEMASKQAEEIIQEKFQRAEQEQFVTTVEEENRDWLFDPQTGNVTPEGLLIHKYIEQAREHGIKGPQARWDYAVAMTERDLLAKRYDQQQQPQQPTQPDNQQLESLQRAAQEFMAQQAAPPQPAAPAPKQPDIAQQNMQYLRREASRNPSRSAGAANPDPRAPKPKLTFEQMLREDASSRGLI